MSRVVEVVSRVGVLGDVHAEDVRLQRAFRVFEQQRVDAVLCVGDVLDGPGDVGACLDALQARKVRTVAGNHERWFLAHEMRTLPMATTALAEPHVEVLRAWPRTLDLDTPLGRLRLGHGIGDDDMAELRPDTRGYALQAIPTLRELMLDPEVAFHVGGHTHERMCRVFPGLVTLNAGTLTGDDPTVLVIDFAARRVQHVSVAADDPKPIEEHELPLPPPVPG